MDAVTDRLADLKRLSVSELQKLAPGKSEEARDHLGKRISITTWCERLEHDAFRVMVSVHRLYPLGMCKLTDARGFTIDALGNRRDLEQGEVWELFA